MKTEQQLREELNALVTEMENAADELKINIALDKWWIGKQARVFAIVSALSDRFATRTETATKKIVGLTWVLCVLTVGLFILTIALLVFTVLLYKYAPK